MSIEVISAVLDSDIGPTHKRFVLLALANNANKAGYCKPGVATLCGATGVARSTVFRILKELENDDGLLQRRKRRRRNGSQTSNAYRINVEALRARRRVVSDEETRELESLFDDDDVSPGEDWVPLRDSVSDLHEPADMDDHDQQGPAAGPPPSRCGTPARPAAGPPEPSDEPSDEPRSLRVAELHGSAPLRRLRTTLTRRTARTTAEAPPDGRTRPAT